MANLPIERIRSEVDPDSDLGWLLLDRSPEALLAYLSKFFTVPNERGQIVSLDPNAQQIQMARDETGRDLTIKARQTGSSTFKVARRVRRMTNGEVMGANCLIAFDKDATTAYFRDRIHHHLRDLRNHGFDFKLSADNDEEIVIAGLDNRWRFASGEQRHIARGLAYQEGHFSEFAHWNANTAAELVGETLPAIPPPPYGNVDIESTPAGDSGEFYELSMSAKPLNPNSLWTVHFIPWWIEPRYRVANDHSIHADVYMTKAEYEKVVSSFEPTDQESRLMTANGLKVDQILWRRIKKEELDRTPTPFAQEFPEDFDSCWLGVEGRYFDTPDLVDHLDHYRSTKRDPIAFMEKLTYNGTEVHFFGRNMVLWEYPKPGASYVAWGDAAGGGTTKDSDFTCIVVWDVQREKVVARVHLQCSPKHAGAIMCAVGTYYNTALSGWERSQHGESALEEMKELSYPQASIYKHIDPEKGLRKNETPQPGIYPTPQNRQRALENFKQGITYHRPVIEDALGVSEMTGFTWQKVQKRMKAQAASGQHDDWIMAAAWGYYILDYARTRFRRRGVGSENEDIVVGKHGLVISRGGPRGSLGPRKPWFR